MIQVKVILRRYLIEFSKNIAQQIFFIFIILCVGGLVPVISDKKRIQLLALLSVSVILLVQNVSRTFVQEKEKKTIETLLSTHLTVRNMIYGTAAYNIIIVTFLATAILLLQIITNSLIKRIFYWNLLEIILLIAAFLVTYIYITIAGLMISLRSDNLQMASRKMSARALGILFYLSICLVTWEIGNHFVFYILLFFYIISVTFIIIYKLCFALSKITREQIIIGKPHKKNKKLVRRSQRDIKDVNFGPLSQVVFMFNHEWRYTKTYKRLFNHFLLMIALPSIVLMIFFSQSKDFDFRMPIIAIILLVARIPMNLIAISIGGEKAYKTFESLLSTPVSLRTMFIAKVLPSIIVSGVVLFSSAVTTLLVANLLHICILREKGVIVYSFLEWLLFIGDGYLISILMVFISGVLALMSKSPRTGLWISVFVSPTLAIPHAWILYGSESKVFTSIAYFIGLLIINVLCFTIVLNKVDRKILLSKI